jgi:uncharacterized membrane protein
LADYDRISPGFAERILAMAERNASHRHDVEKTLIAAQMKLDEYEAAEVKRGQICAVLITVCALVAGAYTAIQGHEISGAILGGAGVTGIVTTLVMGRKQKSPEPTNPTDSKVARKHKTK